MLLLLAVGFSPVYASGFYFDEFRQGMKLYEAMNVAKSRGAVVELWPQERETKLHYEVDFGPRKYMMTFCGPNNGLNWLSYSLGRQDSQFMTFMRFVKKYQTDYSLAIVDTKTEIEMGYDGQQYASIDITMCNRNDQTWCLRMTMMGRETWDISGSQAAFFDTGPRTPGCKY